MMIMLGRRDSQRLNAIGTYTARIAVDIGGTFTDLILLVGGRVNTVTKVLTTPGDPSAGVETGLARLLKLVEPRDVTEVVHGTTLVSNALIERKGAATGLITTRGFRDVLHLQRELRYDLYDLFLDMPEPLVPRRLIWEVGERVLADGTVEQAFDPNDVRRLARRARREGLEALAVSLLHAYRHPEHEREIARILNEELPDVDVAVSSEVSPELGEFQRTSTTVANAYVLPLIDRYLTRLRDRLNALNVECPLRIMLSTGALTTVDSARRFPVRLLESGPAAGVLSAALTGSQDGRRDVMAFDMGGTTAKAALVEQGKPLLAREHEAARVYRFTKGSGLPLRVPVIDLIEIGAGGGSIAGVGPLGLLKVGPQSAGADPGPVCYGLGGDEPTVTDADLLLGYLNPEYFLGGEIRLDYRASQQAVGRLGVGLGLGIEATAAAIYRVVNENMASAARMHAIERGRDLRRFALVATGGAGPVHAWGVARNLGIKTLVFPSRAGVASAYGMLTAPPAFDFARSLPSALGEIRWSDVGQTVDALVRDGTAQLNEAGIGTDQIEVSLAADVRHRGQGDTITVGLGNDLGPNSARQVKDAFDQAYVHLYGRGLPGVEPEVLTWRVRVAGPLPLVSATTVSQPTRHALKGTRPVWFAETDGYIDAAVYDRSQLPPGTWTEGPAVLEERESTVVLGPGGAGITDAAGNLEVKIP